MFARSTTVMGEPSSMETGIAYVRDQVVPAVTALEGCVGMSILVNRRSGRSIATSSWASAEAMQAAEEKVAPHRAKAAEIIGGPQYIDEWEVALMHREQDAADGTACRVTWLETTRSRVEEVLDFYKTNVLPRFEEIDGFCSSSMLVNRDKGRLCSTVRLASVEILEGTRDMAARLRAARTEMGGVTFTDLDEMELILARLRAPELV